MYSLRLAYNCLHRSTEKLVKIYSPQINLNHLKIDKDTTDCEIKKNLSILDDLSKKPEYSHIILSYYEKKRNN